MSAFSRNLKVLRKENGMTQPRLAELVGVSKGMISFWENEICEPTAGNIVKLCRLFSVSADYLLGLDEQEGGQGERG